MKFVSIYTDSHKEFKDEWLLPSLKDDYDLDIHYCKDIRGGKYLDDGWTKAVRFKSEVIIQTIKGNWNEEFIYSDMDVQFFGPAKPTLQKLLPYNDIVCQINNPNGSLCTGFMALKANDKTLKLWEGVQKFLQKANRDQLAFNQILRMSKDIRHSPLPKSFFGGGTFSGRRWSPGDLHYIPFNPIMHHANGTIGIENKVHFLKQVKNIIENGPVSILKNNLNYSFRSSMRH